MSLSAGKKTKTVIFQAALLILVAAAGLVSIFLGKVSFGSFDDPVFHLRLSRTLCALSAGAALSASGAVFQSVFRNRMADPYLLGASSGASFVIALLTIISSISGFSLYRFFPAAAFSGAAAASFLTLTLSRKNGRTPTLRLLLTGIAISFFLGSFTPILLAFSGKDLYTVFFFLNGTTQGKSLSEAQLFLLLTFAGIAVIALNHRKIDFLLLGEERSYQLGFDVEKAKLILLVAASFLTGISVSFCGIVGFLGLVIPNTTRRLIRESTLSWIISTSLSGAAFLIFADFLSRNLFFPREIPLNSFTALIGAPFLVWMVRKNA